MKLFFCLVGIILFFSLPVHAEEKKGSFLYNDHAKRDPLWPLVSVSGNLLNYSKEEAVNDMQLQGILVGPDGKNLAIIDGEVVKIGATIGAYKIKNVGKDFVELQKGEEVFVLKINKEEVK